MANVHSSKEDKHRDRQLDSYIDSLFEIETADIEPEIQKLTSINTMPPFDDFLLMTESEKRELLNEN